MKKSIGNKIVGWMWLIGALVWASMGHAYPLAAVMAVTYVLIGRYWIKR